MDATIPEDLKRGLCTFRYQPTFVGGDAGQNRQEDVSNRPRLRIDPIGNGNEPSIRPLDPFDDGQQIEGASTYPVDPMSVDDITRTKLVQQGVELRTLRMVQPTRCLFLVDVSGIDIRVMPGNRVDLGIDAVNLISRGRSYISQFLRDGTLPR